MSNKLLKVLTMMITVVVTLSILGYSYVTISKHKLNVATTERLIASLYTYNNMDTLINSTETIRKIVSPEVFSILDNSNRGVLTRRFARYTPTVASIRELSINGNRAMAIVGFNKESELPDKLIVLEFGRGNLVVDYKEYDFVKQYQSNYDYLGHFEESMEETEGCAHGGEDVYE